MSRGQMLDRFRQQQISVMLFTDISQLPLYQSKNCLPNADKKLDTRRILFCRRYWCVPSIRSDRKQKNPHQISRHSALHSLSINPV